MKYTVILSKSDSLPFARPIVFNNTEGFSLCWGLTTRQPLVVILGHLPEKGRKEIEEIVEEMKDIDREERGEGTEEITTFPLYPYLLRGQQALPNCKPISVGRPGDKRYSPDSILHKSTVGR